MKTARENRILIIEDSDDIRVLLTDLLESEGYRVDHAADGGRALAFLASLGSKSEYPGVILLDLMMPDMDGNQFREEQLRRSLAVDVPIVLMSADRDIQSKMTKLNARALLKKPFVDIEQILKTIGAFFPSP